MKSKGGEPLDVQGTSSSPINDVRMKIEEAVTQGYVVSQSSEDRQPRLERLMVTMLAAMINVPRRPINSEARARELAELLIDSVRAIKTPSR